MSAHRVQLSLQILDDKLYSDFIEELKVNRTLNTKIIDVLSAYYYNIDLRRAIDDYTKGDKIKEEYDTSTDTNELFADILNSMAVSNFYAEEALQTLDEGAATIDDILHQTTQHAQEDGFYEDINESEYGFETPKLLTEVNEQNVKKVAKKVQETTSSSSSSSEHEAFLEKIVLKLCDMVGLDPNSIDATQQSVQEVAKPVQNTETQSVEVVKETVITESKPVEEVKEVVKPTEQKPTPKPVEEVKETVTSKSVETESEEDDGFAALMESLDSLSF